MDTVSAEFFYRKPLREDEPKPAFGLVEPDPDRPDHQSFTKKVSNARGTNQSLKESGFKLIEHVSSVDDFYDDQTVMETYYPEMAELVKQQTDASVVHNVSHITRNEAEAQSGKRLGAHRLVHNDFTPQFLDTIEPLIGEANPKPDRVAVYNLWRRFDKDCVDAPLALCDSRTVSEEELIPTDLHNYGSGEGFQVEIFQSSYRESHRWYYYPKMNREELVMFKTYDSSESPFVPTLHSAFDDQTILGANVSPRESIEVRAICFFFDGKQ